MTEKEFVRRCKNNFTKVRNEGWPDEEHAKLYTRVFRLYHSDWIARSFSPEAEAFAKELIKVQNSPLMKALA